MEFPSIVLFIIFFPSVLGSQHKYKVLVDNFTVAYSDDKYIDVSAGICEFNNTNAVNITFTMKINFPNNAKCLVKAFVLHSSDIGLPIFELERNFKEIIEMKIFDMPSLWVRRAKPPVKWPIKKNVTYRIEKWIPDSTQMVPNLPEGRMKVEVTQKFANKTAIVGYNSIVRIVY